MPPTKKKPAPKRRPAKAKAAASPFPPIPAGIRITHPERVVYAEWSITKGDVAAYYAAAAERMLPHVVNRPLSIVRCPAGQSGECFFQKHPPVGMPDTVARVRIRERKGISTYLAIHDMPGLLSLVQFGALEIHIWGSLVDDVERPNRIIFDLDPGPGVPWERLVDAALLLRGMLKQLGLTTFVMTTGGKGLHVVAPLVPKHEWPEVKAFCRNVAETLATARPEEFLSNMSKAKRTAKIFVDYLRNDRGATAVAPYSTRARPGATIAMPISWRELKTISGGDAFRFDNVAPRLKARAADPWRGIDEIRQLLPARAPKAASRRTVG